MTSYPLTSALAGQMASKWGEKNPTVDTGSIDDFSHLVLPLPRRFPVNHSIPKCVYVLFTTKKCLFALNVQTQSWLSVNSGGSGSGVGLHPHMLVPVHWLFWACCATGCFVFRVKIETFMFFIIYIRQMSDYITFWKYPILFFQTFNINKITYTIV